MIKPTQRLYWFPVRGPGGRSAGPVGGVPRPPLQGVLRVPPGELCEGPEPLGRQLARVIIVDNSPASYVFHPENAVSAALRPVSWCLLVSLGVSWCLLVPSGVS